MDASTDPHGPSGDRQPRLAPRRVAARLRGLVGRPPIALALILALALGLRLYGINWDGGALFHPDERAMLGHVVELRIPTPDQLPDLFDASQSPLNPRWFNYGSLPLYVLKAVQTLAAPFADWDVFDLRLPGRAVSALADTAVVGLLFAFGKRWYGVRTGLVAAALAALAVISIQLSHFFAVDTLLTLFTTAAVFFMTRVAYRGSPRDSAIAGIFVGLAVATKVSAMVLGLPLVVAHGIYAFSAGGDRLAIVAGDALAAERKGRALRGLLASGLAAGVSLFAGQPYTFLDFGTFFAHVSEQAAMVRRAVDFPYTRQYIDTPKYLYQAWQLGTWGLGPVLGLLSWAGFLGTLAYGYLRRRKVDLVVLAWVVPYLAITGWFDVKFLRYMLPLVPFLLLFAARLLSQLYECIRAAGPRLRRAGFVLLAVLLALTLHYTASFESIYARPHPANRASEWLNQNAYPGDVILKEHWEEGIPRLGRFRIEELELYNPDSERKFERIAEQLAKARYLVFYSKRLYATIPRLPERYPLSASYYRALFAGELGYRLAYVSESVPGILGVRYDDDNFGRTDIGPPAGYAPDAPGLFTLSFGWADESFTVYDHPKVLVFENVGKLTPSAIRAAIGGAPPTTGLVPISGLPTGLMLSEKAAAKQVAGGTYSDIVQLSGDSSLVSWAVWLVAAQLIGLLGLPIGFVLFRPLADRGYLLTKALGVLLVSFLAWIMASVGIAEFSRWSVLIAMAVVALVSGVTAWRQRDELRAFLRQHARLIVLMEALFLAAFFAFLMVRAANPDLWHPYRGGEKPMDFAFLNAVVRSSVMPPYDPWFAGGYLNYYYFGQFIVATLIRLTGIAPSVAYNLAVPLLFALTVGGAFSIVFALAEGARRARGGAGRWARGTVLAGMAAAVLVAVAGNVDGFGQVAEGTWDAVVRQQPFGEFDYWRSSRMMERDSPGNEITEFPFFTFLFADLHAHLIALPFTLLALGLTVSMFLDRSDTPGGTARRWAVLAALGLALGALRVMNTWDFPGYALLAAFAAAGRELVVARKPVGLRIRAALLNVAVIALVSYVAYLPFHQHFRLYSSGVQMSQWQTPLWRYLVIHLPFLYLLLTFAAWRIRRALPAILHRLGMPFERFLLYLTIPVALGATAAFMGFATAAFAAIAAAIAAGLGIAALLARRREGRIEALVAAMAALAFAIGAGVDILTVKNDIGRMNTVFKFYLQAWVLFGLASAYVLWRFGQAGHLSLKRLTPLRGVWLVLLAGLLGAAMIYPVMGTRARIRDRFGTSSLSLDGMAFMSYSVQREKPGPLRLRYDLQAIRWLQDNVKGSPVIVEGLTDLYRWGNRVSIYTGLPAVVGWDWHERQQRVEYADDVMRRRADVARIYNTEDPEEAVRLMRKYGAQLLYVGELERLYYAAKGLAKFDRMRPYGLVPVYQTPEVKIYVLGPAPVQAGASPPDVPSR